MDKNTWNVSEEGANPRKRADGKESSPPQNSSDVDQTKRLRTTEAIVVPGLVSPALLVPGLAASPPKFVSLEEIMKAARDIDNMSLVHEIAVDSNFKLEKFEPPPNSLHKQVSETMHKAFWDVLTAQLNEDPPCYTHAMALLEEIKSSLLSLLLPQHTKLRQEINEILDVDLIRQQAEAGILDFPNYAHYVISVMGKLCAPVRDDKIKELTETKEIVPVFREILEMLKLMHMDMANFAISVVRPDLIAKSVDYEKAKFAEILKIQPDGLRLTREWVLKHLARLRESGVPQSSDDRETNIRNLVTRTMAEAYLELLEWDQDTPFPETVMMDAERFRSLGRQHARMVVLGAVLLTALSLAGQVQGSAAFKEKLRGHVSVLLEEANTGRDIERLIPNIEMQVVKDVEDFIKETGSVELTPENKETLSRQIREIGSSSHKIRQLVCSRVREFLHQSITSPTAAPQQVPPGLSSLRPELTATAGQFLHLVSHNRAVFGGYYHDMVAAAVP
ncbi:T-complex protein 11-like protein 1 [Bacillus rossius redtenbacheri]|uniref:T-complex protein 11-like protein 1 n=1 Tax=Bacillus rossius redtenbacheri TaxID=93214 RepID=UPI002FDC8516